ncbi:hypothetical protein [Gulbenkiania mobilis]
MKLASVRSVCFTICIVSIVVGLLLGLAMIWDVVQDSALAWKAFMTIGLFFIASTLTLTVVHQLGDDER